MDGTLNLARWDYGDGKSTSMIPQPSLNDRKAFASSLLEALCRGGELGSWTFERDTGRRNMSGRVRVTSPQGGMGGG